jgi:hypothetical protein
MNANVLSAESKEAWSVAVLYEDSEVRQRALRVGDHLMRQFWSEIEFDFNWWRFSFLEDLTLAQQAGRHLADADVVILALRREGELPANLKRWLEEFLAARGVREGAFIALFDEEGSPPPTGCRRDLYLRSLAQRSGMDYLREAPSALPCGLPDSLDGFSERAEEHTSIMENILSHTPPPRPYS